MVQVANGEKICCSMSYGDMGIANEDYAYKAELLVMDMSPIDDILGCTWLVTLGSFTLNII